jgi:hypothetical protein
MQLTINKNSTKMNTLRNGRVKSWSHERTNRQRNEKRENVRKRN